MDFGIDVVTGAVTLSRGTSVCAGITADEAVAAFGDDTEGLLIEGSRYLMVVTGALAGRTFEEVTLRFGAKERLETVSFGDKFSIRELMSEHESIGHGLLRTRRNRDFVRGLLGPPGYENARGSLHAYPWGFVYAHAGGFSIVYPGRRAPVPLPSVPAKDQWPFFRCAACGHVMDLGYGLGVLEVGRNRGGAPCEACGAVAWVQVGSTTEFYRYSQRPWVCEVGMHPADDVKLFRLVPPDEPAKPGTIRLKEVLIKACPAHVAALRGGWLGCSLPEGAAGEDPR